MKTNRIRLTENQLRQMVGEAVKNVLKEDLTSDGYYDRENTAKRVLRALEQLEKMLEEIGEEIDSLHEQDHEYYESVSKDIMAAWNFVRNAIYIMSEHGVNGKLGKLDSQGFHPDTYFMGMGR
ncbi:MAG: hypothetical protein MJZ16_08955 [Bacteroidales bacterium]|nr:hypothetical protein [Bacteroidales bacterium]